VADSNFLAKLGARFAKPVKPRRWASPLQMAHDLEGLTLPAHQRFIDERLVAMADGSCEKLCVSLPPQHGKHLGVDEVVPTPFGWTTIGAIRVGDKVFDENGRVCTVTALFARKEAELWAVEFDDGTRVITDDEHQWQTITWKEGRRLSDRRRKTTGEPNVDWPEDWATTPWLSANRTTADMAATLGDKHLLPLHRGLDLDPATLPVDPWLLGYWLGNGTAVSGGITTGGWGEHQDCAFVLGQVRRAGYDAKPNIDEERHRGTMTPYGLVKDLRAAGVLSNKHVPAVYLRASQAQRLALLAGLLDSDGTINEGVNGTCSAVDFAVQDTALAFGVVELVRSLGAKPSMVERPAKLNGRETGKTVYRVTFTPPFQPFTLPRKAAKWKPPASKGRERVTRYVRSVRPLGVRGTVRCIAVDSPSRCFLVGEAMVPTHNSTITTLWLVLWLLDTDPDLRIVIISYNETYAASWGREAKRIIDKHQETLGWSVAPDSKANALWRVKGHQGGAMYIGVGGGLGGWTVNWVINDDWVKNHEDGFNIETHEKNWTFHQSTVEQRIQHGVKEIVNMTRWSEADLVGKVTSHAPDEWEVVALPAIAEDDDPLGRPVGQGLWLEKNPQSWYDKKKASLSAFIWAGLYQQRPSPEGGGILKKAHFRYFSEVNAFQTSDGMARWQLSTGEYVDPAACTRFGTADTASSTRTSADWTVVGAWAVTPAGDLLLFDVARTRVEEDDLPGLLSQFMFRNKLPWLGVEATFATSDLAYQMGRMGVRFHALKADQDKLQRALPLRTRLEQHRLHFLAGASWLADLEHEFLSFTGKSGGGHDDIVDMCAYASRHLDTSAGALGQGSSRARKKKRTAAQWRAVGSG